MLRQTRIACGLAVVLGLGLAVGCSDGPAEAPAGQADALPVAPAEAAQAPPALGPPPP